MEKITSHLRPEQGIRSLQFIKFVLAREIQSYFLEYENQETLESHYVYDFDKMDMLIQAKDYEYSMNWVWTIHRIEYGIDLSQFFESTTEFKTEWGKEVFHSPPSLSPIVFEGCCCPKKVQSALNYHSLFRLKTHKTNNLAIYSTSSLKEGERGFKNEAFPSCHGKEQEERSWRRRRPRRWQTNKIQNTLKRTPGISPTAWPERPKPAMRTSSYGRNDCGASLKQHTFSSMKLRQPSRGTKAVIFLPFLINWQRMALRIAELGCLDSTPLWTLVDWAVEHTSFQ